MRLLSRTCSRHGRVWAITAVPGSFRRPRKRSCGNMAARFPMIPLSVRALPGVGRYIAGAILSFAFDRPEPIVEANSQRVLARLLAISENLKTASTSDRLWQAAARLVPAAGAGTFNQALMELGALVCTPREPACLVCPLSDTVRGPATRGSRTACRL